MKRLLICCGAALALSCGSASAAKWTLGPQTDYVCLSGGTVKQIQYCHNCAAALGNQAKVRWTFKEMCDGKEAGKREVRGELACSGNYGNETQQNQKIRANAESKLPPATTPCP
ncbi:hypothetical protein [Chromobacterium phragmitis]|uniref:Secreted protein n=1 Tax=Chromobacterium phragmitis TaxID=2202141 RepID=A0ABV0IPL3_9NEIS|nr:hypothetical protein [Chromobacterium phragmitis]